MLRIIFCVFLFSIASSGFSQSWFTDFEEASKTASEEHKAMILVFQGSDWCAPCMKLDREIWQSDFFKDYASEHFVMVKVDFPRRKQNELSAEQQEHNNTLAEKYNERGYFPFVVIMDETGQVVGSMGYEKISPEEYVKRLESFKS